jgi:hypothetical protein
VDFSHLFFDQYPDWDNPRDFDDALADPFTTSGAATSQRLGDRKNSRNRRRQGYVGQGKSAKKAP